MVPGLAVRPDPSRVARWGGFCVLGVLAGACTGSITDPNAASPASNGRGPAKGGPQQPPVVEVPPDQPGCAADPTPARIWRLSDEQYGKAVSDLLPGVKVPPVTTPGRSNAEF